jgi:hypothetical protein
MTLAIAFRRPALLEFEAAALWYEAQRPGLGGEFEAEITLAVEAAADTPMRFPLVLK